MSAKTDIQKPAGKLGVMTVGMGAVATTFIAGIMSIRKGLSKPIGSLTQMGSIRLGKRTEKKNPLIKDFIELAGLDDLVFGGWDIFPDNAYEAAVKAGVLRREHLNPVRTKLAALKPWPAVFDQRYVKNLHGDNVKKAATKYDYARLLMDDIQDFKKAHKLDRMVMIWCASTEIFLKREPVHETIKAFEKAMKGNHPSIAPSMIYAYAALQSGVPFANGAPNLTVDIPAMWQLAREKGVPISGKDFKTGQTLMKTILAPGFKARLLGLNGWFSTNILGNRDGEVLDDPESFKTKEESKLSVLEYILQPGVGYPMQIKVDFLCRDSILAAPIVLDLVLFMDLARRAGMKGIQEWLSFYFKSPMCAPELYPEHDLFIQLMKLKNTLRHLKGEELITHLGLEYYD